MRQEQDFPTTDFLGEERQNEKGAEYRGVFYEEDGSRRGEENGKAEEIADAGKWA